MEDVDELLSDLRVICRYLADSEIEGYRVDLKDAIYMAQLFQDLDKEIMEEGTLPYDWTEQ